MRRARERGSASRGVRRACELLLSTLVVLVAFGCQLVAGDFKVEPPTSGDADASSCKTGDYRCNGEYLLTCGATNAGWILKQTCGSADLCDSKAKQCQVCKPGDQRCDGVSREECNTDGTDWQTLEMCSSADICNATFCGNCNPGEYSCRGESSSVDSELWQCGPDGTWSVHLDDCATVGLCSSTLDVARSSMDFDGKCMTAMCDAGTYNCDGATLEHCRQDQTAWDVVDTCSTQALCTAALASPAATAGSLDMCPSGCGTAGAYLCNGMTLTQCRTDLTGFDTVTTCGADTECNPVVGACTDLCTPGQYQCNDATLRLCSSTQHWVDQTNCASASLCKVATDGSTGACVPPTCPQAGVYVCNGTALSKCADDLSGYVMVSTCASADLCSAADKRCEDPACMPNELRCFDVSVNGAVESQLRQCNAGFTDWTDMGDPCPTGQFCSNDASDPGCKLNCPSPTRCNGSELQNCTPDGWVHQATCATTDLCSCTLDMTCTAGVGTDQCGIAVCGGSQAIYQCAGEELQRCDDGRNAWDNQADCGDPTLCYPGAAPAYNNGYCAVCPLAGETQCVDASPDTVRKCSPDRTMWTTSATCGSLGCIDSGTADYCAACNAGAVTCNGPALQTCPADEKAYTTLQCNSATLCDVADDRCNVCTPPNSSTCVGNVLQHCSSDGQMLQSTTCPTLCDASKNRCDSCTAGTSRCSNNILYTCNSDGQTETPTTCVTAGLCDATDGKCITPTCNPGTFNCSGAELQTCNAQQNGWDNKTACSSAALCDATHGKCIAPTCNPGTFDCMGAELQTCNAMQNGWDNKTACTSAALCDATDGKCIAPTCNPGDFDCMGAELQTCNAMQNGWDNKTACSSVALCDAKDGKCIAATCNPGDFNCSGAELQTCNAMQNGWDNKTACTSAALCDAKDGKCVAATCNPGDFNCMGAELQTCNAMQNGWDNKTACGSAALCDATDGKCVAATCNPGDFNCMGAELQTCNAMQNGWDNKTACGSPALCDATDGKCVAATCNPGDLNCMGAELQTCNADQTGWTNQMMCSSAALCDAANGECDDCAAPAYECMMNVLYTCDTTGHFVMSMDCGTGTCDPMAGMCSP